MSEAPKLLLGLVTHSRSRFNANGQATRMIMELAGFLRDRGMTVQTLISDRNDFDAKSQKIGVLNRLDSARAQVQTEWDWSKYLQAANGVQVDSGDPGRFFFFGMFIKRAGSFLLSSRPLERLANIDLSHLRVLEEGVKSNSDWILIIEDDGKVENIEVVADKINTLVTNLDHVELDTFVNLSESIEISELRADHMFSNSKEVFTLEDGEKVIQFLLPISNTVCANMYSRGFAARFANAIKAQGTMPSIPIDWRLNHLLMDSSGSSIQGLWVTPGIFLQGSMQIPVGGE